jgi:hypothetical protein
MSPKEKSARVKKRRRSTWGEAIKRKEKENPGCRRWAGTGHGTGHGMERKGKAPAAVWRRSGAISEKTGKTPDRLRHVARATKEPVTRGAARGPLSRSGTRPSPTPTKRGRGRSPVARERRNPERRECREAFGETSRHARTRTPPPTNGKRKPKKPRPASRRASSTDGVCVCVCVCVCSKNRAKLPSATTARAPPGRTPSARKSPALRRSS